jgi:steroid 5-alpha reductase family enzyme
MVQSLAALAVLLVCGAGLWLLSRIWRDVSIVDIFWGPAFAIVAWTRLGLAGEPSPRALLVAVLVSLWATRLAVYLAWRNHGQPEDRRYQAMRQRQGPSFANRALLTVFWLQCGLAFFVSAPVQVAVTAAASPWGLLDFLGLLLFALGLGFESIGDWQLSRFKADPANRGQVMDRGLWRFTRHPNYFGDFCVWWGFYLLALPAGGLAWLSALGPLVMSVLLLRVSGVSLLEADIAERRPAYVDYVRRTSAFFPWPPGSNRDAPPAP